MVKWWRKKQIVWLCLIQFKLGEDEEPMLVLGEIRNREEMGYCRGERGGFLFEEMKSYFC